ncbi:MAG: hypothetical protein KAX31_04305 [Thermoplasmata archaeon]|nr:hypothetical protein [Thermoplasmata archaeon]
MKSKIIEKECIVCGTKLSIKLFKDGTHKGGYYFGKLEIDIGEGEHVKVGECDLGDWIVDVVDWTGETKKVEYWECDKCYYG